jgi:hypothetical protein
MAKRIGGEGYIRLGVPAGGRSQLATFVNLSKRISTFFIMALMMPSLLVFLLLNLLALTNATPKFTPEAMLSLPRRGTAEPNAAGTLALYSSSTWNFTTHKRSHELYVMDIKTGHPWLFTNASIGEAHWLGDQNEIVWLVYGDDGSTSFVVGDAKMPANK